MKKIKIGLIIVLLGITIFSFWKILTYNKGIQEEQEQQKELIEISEIPEEIEEDSSINFEELLKINPGIVGWIYIEDTNVNYPIVQGKDNTYYLNHSIYKDYSIYGSIYMDATANADFSSDNTFIYGHYTRNSSMFGELGKYMNQSFFDEHPVFYLFTLEGNYKVEVFSVHVDDASSPSYQMNFSSDDAYDKYLKLMKEKSAIKSNVEVSTEDRIITLYSCSREANYKKNDRYYVHGKLEKLN